MNSDRTSPTNLNAAQSLRAKAIWVTAIGLMATVAATYVAATTPITAVM